MRCDGAIPLINGTKQKIKYNKTPPPPSQKKKTQKNKNKEKQTRHNKLVWPQPLQELKKFMLQMCLYSYYSYL